MTGLTDPVDDFYNQHPELVDLDKAIEQSLAANRLMLERLAENAPRTEVANWQDVVNIGAQAGDVFLVVDTPTGYATAFLARLGAYAVDPDEADR
jgi:protein-L-isoaspartate O-methyltransferase